MAFKYFKNVAYKSLTSKFLSHLVSNFPVYALFFVLGVFSARVYYISLDSDGFNYKYLLYKILRANRRPSLEDSDDDDDDYKLVLCVRMDLPMGRGKIAAQCGHASIGAYTDAVKNNDPYVEKWFNRGQRKVVVKIEDYDQMKELNLEAKLHNINTNITRDAGKTQIPSGSCTVIAIGPGPDRILDKITGHLKLL